MPSPEIAADSYGTPEGVAALSGTWTESGGFFDADPPYAEASDPSLTSVVSWIDEVSAILNTALGNHGFKTPLSSAKSKKAADLIVNRIVSDLVDYAKSKGRFISAGFQKGTLSIFQAIVNDVDAWIGLYAPGLEANGDERSGTSIRIGYKSVDDSGKEVSAIFQRKAFGNVFEDWDK